MKILTDVNGIENKIIFMITFFEQPQQVWECNTVEEGIKAYKEFDKYILKYGKYFNINSLTLICKNNLIAQKVNMIEDRWVIIKDL